MLNKYTPYNLIFQVYYFADRVISFKNFLWMSVTISLYRRSDFALLTPTDSLL